MKRRGWCFTICYRLLFANTTTIVINYCCCHWLYSVGVAHFSDTKINYPALIFKCVVKKHLFSYKQGLGILLAKMLPISQLLALTFADISLESWPASKVFSQSSL